MKTRYLWVALRNSSPHSPLFKQTFARNQLFVDDHLRASTPKETIPPRTVLRYLLLGGLFMVGCGWGILASLLCLAPLFILVIITAGISYGSRCAIETSIGVAHEQENNTYDLLCVTPIGRFGINWTACASNLRRFQYFDMYYQILKWGTIFLMVGGLLILLLVFLRTGYSSIAGNSLDIQTDWISQNAINLIILSLAVNLDFVQSIVIGSLIGMLIPSYTQKTMDARLITLTSFLAFQVGGYILSFTLGFAILPLWFESGLSDSVVTTLLLPILQLAIFFTIREVLIRILWRMVLLQLNGETYEIDMLRYNVIME